MISLIQKQQEQKHFGQYFTGVRLEQYKKENFSQYQRSIYIDGYLHDYASELCEIRLGEERGSQVILNELLRASEPSVIGGFDDLEMVEIFQLISIFESPLISISGFNPAIESFKTPKFIVHLIYEYTRALIEQEI
ncbi:hypothetical protein PPERSA_09370 [Pseudocohnilembus persalinus]|uniref:Uncharacterized protein n=1 Tax=Pseudocohnilembus persalinus TaxID=266149 RepID=A0A0V0QLJ2_PSEPJ|nr:hypothetical protein PPERSA_09370 [Pseudocohnilembus persalinus]|eukprot:KRX02952.1 hypothetical protein PPERSA_09370 [Pseudocohnilembus persalinus]